jgi:hypothetical protein
MMRAYIQESLASLAVAVYLVEGDEGQERYIQRHIGGDVWQRELLPAAAATQIEPSLTLSNGQARALLDALSSHYAGASDTRQLRADYDAERRRVDKMLDALTVHLGR